MKKNKIIYTIIFVLSLQLHMNANDLSLRFKKIANMVEAPDFSLKSENGDMVKLSDYKGKTVILNFWATWCPPCKKEMPSLERFYKKAKDKNIVVLAITVGQDEDSVFPFINTLNPVPTFPILLDTNSNVARQWSISAMPTTVIINKEGYLSYFALGAREFDNPKFLKELLKL